jgi:hypothetical protein
MRQAEFVNGRKWDGFHFDVLRDEYLAIRMDLLEQVLGNRLEEYVKKHCTIAGY